MRFYSKWEEIICILGEFICFCGRLIYCFLYTIQRRQKIFLKNCAFFGYEAVLIHFIGAIFLGSVLGYQLFASLHRFQAESFLGGTVGVTLFRELAPVMSAIMSIGRSGAAVAAYLASQKINEQVDALEIMGIDPIEYLVAPKVLASLCMSPFLVLFFALTATWSAYFVATFCMGLEGALFTYHFFQVVTPLELIHCLVKNSVFSFLFTAISCFCGLKAYGGVQNVGLATRDSVVVSTLVVLLMDYLLTSVLPFGFENLQLT